MLEQSTNKNIDNYALPQFFFDQELKEIALQPEEWKKYVQQRIEKLIHVDNDEDRLNLLAQLGYASRVLMNLEEAESYLIKALTLSFFHPDKTKFIQNSIRLAHVYQWQKNFAKAHLLFDQAKMILNEEPVSDGLLASYHQHLGKFYFDQGFVRLAQYEFELAFRIRTRMNADVELLNSTQHCLEVVRKLNKDNQDPHVLLRRAEVADAEAIHRAHMKSINEICIQDHTDEEIKAWGGRAFNAAARASGIKTQFYVVAECNGQVEGFMQVARDPHDAHSAHVFGLYLTPEAKGKKAGQRMMNLLSEYCDFACIDKMTLVSSITAFNFYKRQGFIQDGEISGVSMNGVTIRGYPMTKIIN
jgi:tetratricopeptide (TPR) repeat protein